MGGVALGAGGFGATEAAAADSSDVSLVSREPLVLWYAAPAADWEREALEGGEVTFKAVAGQRYGWTTQG